MKSKVDDDIFFSSVVKKALNEEEQSLDMGIRSKLRQMRFNAIDNALPQQPMINRGNFQWGMSIAFGVLFSVLIAMNLTAFKIDGGSSVVVNNEDTDEALEMYEWLYNNYG